MSKKEKIKLCILATVVGLFLFVLGLWGGSYVFHEIAIAQGKKWMEMPTFFSGMILIMGGTVLAIMPWSSVGTGGHW